METELPYQPDLYTMRILTSIFLFNSLWAIGLTTAQDADAQATTAQEIDTSTLCLLVVDYAMAYPEENAGLVRVFMEAGFEVDVRPYNPVMVERDASDYDAIGEVIPELNGRLIGMAIRVPVPDGSLTDFVVQIERVPTADEVNAAFAAAGSLNGILEYCEDLLERLARV